ncbi:MAG: bifunctional glycosyltransferase family 2/GtrA family protein [Clostridiales bacterium]|nr:bifunctional glycosyltransferase family 2/GtrA family protein [Clostridiales bacterium]
MTEENKRIILIPAYEPTELMLSVLEIAHNEGFDIIVVDDGSGIGFADIFEKAEEYAAVIYHSENRGKGCALKTGLQFIKDNFKPPYTVVTMDADGQHSVLDAAKAADEAERNPDTLILGSRSLEQNVPARSRMGNSITRLVFKASTGLGIHDTQTGLRGFSHRLLPVMLEIPGERYEYEMNMLLCFADKGLPVKEVPILTIYFENIKGSHFSAVKDSYRIYKEILKFSASSLFCFVIDYLLFSGFSVMLSSFGSFGLTVSNILARVISGSVNFSVNRGLVFKSRESVFKAGIKYISLTVLILAGNTLVLNLFVYGLGLNKFAAKPLTEVIFFMISWLVQRLYVFNAKENEKGGKQTV